MIGTASPDVHVTAHAVDRYLERIDGTMTRAQVEAAILSSARAITIAAGFGCNTVRQASGTKLVLEGCRVVTVIARFQKAGSVRRDCVS